MAIDGSEFTLKLAFKDSPGPDDDFVSLNSPQFDRDNPANYTGFVMYPGGFTMGPVEDNETWGKVRTLSFQVQLEGKSKTDAIARLRNLNRFILRSNYYFQDAGSNYPSRSDGRWHDGEATVVTFKPADALYEVYWDVIAGTPAQMPDHIEPQNKTIRTISFSLLVRAAGRLTRVRLTNGVAMGDAAPPFTTNSSVNSGNFTAGWGFTGTWGTGSGSSGYQVAKYGLQTLVCRSTGATFITNEFDVVNNEKILPEVWVAFGTVLPSGGTLTVKLQIWNGSVWADQQTFVNLSSFAGLASLSFDKPNWVRYTGTSYTVTGGITKVRLTGVAPTLPGSVAGQIAWDGFAMWRNLINDTVPPTEYATGGKTMGIPCFNVYGLRGDVKTPIKMRIDNPSTTQAQRFFIVSGMTQDLGTPSNRTEYPIFGLDLASQQVGTAATSLPWGYLSGESTGAGTTSSFFLDTSLSRTLDRHPRNYRAFLVYALNDAITVSKVQVGVAIGSSSNMETKTFNVALPNTYTGNTTATASQYGIYELGDFLYSRPGVAWENSTGAIDTGIYVTLTHTSSANRHVSVPGVILLPTKPNALMAATIDVGTSGLARMAVEIYNEGKAPRGAIQVTTASFDIPLELSAYDSTLPPMKGGNMWVLPAEASTPTMAMRFEVLMLRGRNDTTKLYTFDARDTKQVSIEYTPRYLYGLAS